MSVRPSDFPPPWSSAEAIGAPTDPADERIEVGFLIVGAGPAGLAAAIRLGQLAEEDPGTAERLGEVPVAVLEGSTGFQPASGAEAIDVYLDSAGAGAALDSAAEAQAIASDWGQ